MKLTTTRLKKLIREEFERMQEALEDVYSLERSRGDYEMKDGTDFDVGVYSDNSGEERLTVTINREKYMLGDVSKKQEIISQLKSMDLKKAKQFGGPLHGIKGRPL
tara:strand:+ start:1102 stop:1419 length:318 start_codon:yes stop_codon:yes gene_type:complete